MTDSGLVHNRNEISAENLGSWDEESFHVRGDLDIPGGEVSFGVAFRNGLAQPWASGPEPPMDLAQNGGLSGTAAWSGALLGALRRLGRWWSAILFFPSIWRTWADNSTSPICNSTAAGGGGTVTSTTRSRCAATAFTRTGGDAGVVTGAFFGPRHEGMGGVLERSDLSAGFGGKR